MFSAAGTSLGNYDDGTIEVLSLKTGEWKEVHRGGYFGRYVPGGYLLFVRRGTLYGARFDLEHLQVRGTPVPLLEDLAGNAGTGAGQFDFAADGTFVYGDASSGPLPILWLEQSGRTEPLLQTPGNYQAPRFSPDGNRLVLTSGGLTDIQVYDWTRDTMTRLTFNGQGNAFAVWAPDGKHLVYRAANQHGYSLEWLRADGGGTAQRLFDSQNDLRPYSFSPDGTRLTFTIVSSSGNDVWTLPLDITDPEHPKPGNAAVLVQTPFNEGEPAVSPDGRWLAYTSDESGRLEVYVRPFGGGNVSGKWVVSAGGQSAVWSPKGRELFYASLDDRVMAVRYTTQGDSFASERPTVWSTTQVVRPNAAAWSFDVAPDGRRLAILAQPNLASQSKKTVHVTFLLNFFDELRRRISADD
jgi:serine/threonine-protein kinase